MKTKNKIIIELRKFKTRFEQDDRGEHYTETELTYETPIGTTKITVTSNDKIMSTGNFHFTRFLNFYKIDNRQFKAINKIVMQEAIDFVDKLREVLNG
jgi:hypothetical protein